MTLKFCRIKRGNYIRIGMADHRHQNNTRNNIIHITGAGNYPQYAGPSGSQKLKKYKAVVMAGGNMVCGQIRIKRRTSLVTIVNSDNTVTHQTYPPTKSRNKLSNRFDLFFILVTEIPCRVNSENNWLKPFSPGIPTCNVWLSSLHNFIALNDRRLGKPIG